MHFFAKWASAVLKKEHMYKGFGAPAPAGPIFAKKCTFGPFGRPGDVENDYVHRYIWPGVPTEPILAKKCTFSPKVPLWGLRIPVGHGPSHRIPVDHGPSHRIPVDHGSAPDPTSRIAMRVRRGGGGVLRPPLSRTLSPVVEQHLSNLKVC